VVTAVREQKGSQAPTEAKRRDWVSERMTTCVPRTRLFWVGLQATVAMVVRGETGVMAAEAPVVFHTESSVRTVPTRRRATSNFGVAATHSEVMEVATGGQGSEAMRLRRRDVSSRVTAGG
jgi:hypothetical protein